MPHSDAASARREPTAAAPAVPPSERARAERGPRGGAACAGLVALLTALSGAVCSSPPIEDPTPRDELAVQYDAPLIEYLSSLGEQDVGGRLAGLALDPEKPDARVLDGDRYLGRAQGLPRGVHMHLVRHDGETVAYLWVDTDGEPFPLPECDAGRPGFRARTAWGDIYTWRAARPGDGVLVSACPAPSWLTAVPGAATAPEPPP